ncbi:hypothetical protein [Actinacidiphila oryziradicis]|uniref:hypothetical protein n=1 Tax=Actinacidiphila oryziradicis TaxID=2571141 RepID=UPI00145E1764|nr:hypothetical protein [Actinacidiphila oryziradicis]
MPSAQVRRGAVIPGRGAKVFTCRRKPAPDAAVEAIGINKGEVLALRQVPIYR